MAAVSLLKGTGAYSTDLDQYAVKRAIIEVKRTECKNLGISSWLDSFGDFVRLRNFAEV